METVRKNTTKDKAAWLLFERTYDMMENKEFFAFDPAYTPPQEGFTYEIYDGPTLAAAFSMTFPGLDEENLGYDTGMDESELMKVAHMDVAAVDPAYRGKGMQKKLMELGERDAAALGYRHLMCTIHPDNAASLKSALSLGYRIVKTVEKYGGKTRHILIKDI
ncbi:MAG: GNAT family N-acetyltransferase [Bullifex sp.]|nr:GNAT family N-acetyltransferase [Bullifex sp.]MDY3851186.1 GNAT family N-acetyltransferase [Bullifex sp.]MDY5908551.1 GNAT family N-acetyltransferase [Bullifex sp.]